MSLNSVRKNHPIKAVMEVTRLLIVVVKVVRGEVAELMMELMGKRLLQVLV